MMKITPKSGLIAAVVGCVTAGAMVIYTNKQCKKEKEEMDEIMENVKDTMDYVDYLLGNKED